MVSADDESDEGVASSSRGRVAGVVGDDGLVRGGWRITLGPVASGLRSFYALAARWFVSRGDDARAVDVFVTGDASGQAEDGSSFAREIAEAIASEGRSEVMAVLDLGSPPFRVTLTREGVYQHHPDARPPAGHPEARS